MHTLWHERVHNKYYHKRKIIIHNHFKTTGTTRWVSLSLSTFLVVLVVVEPVSVLFYAHCWFKFLLRTALDAYMTPTINPPQININCA